MSERTGRGSQTPYSANDRSAAAKRELELAQLRAGVVPRRYLRNIGTLGLDGQARLLEARVGVAGLGGLGGTVAEVLARAGVGELVLVDPDVLTEDNLNRQLLATEPDLGQPKVLAAVARLGRVNSAVTVRAHQVPGDRDVFARLFAAATVVVDALDSVPARFELQAAAQALGVPLVHGAIAGLSGQVTVVFPGDPGLEVIYGRPGQPSEGEAARPAGKRRDESPGNPSPTPLLVAALEAQEVIKIVSGVGEPLRRKLLILDGLRPYAAVVEL